MKRLIERNVWLALFAAFLGPALLFILIELVVLLWLRRWP